MNVAPSTMPIISPERATSICSKMPPWMSAAMFVRTAKPNPIMKIDRFAIRKSLRGSIALFRSFIVEPQHEAVHPSVDAGRGEIVERPIGRPDHVRADERGPFPRAVLRMLEAAFPLEHGPAVVAVLRELAEDRLEIDLAVARRAKPARPVDPALVAAVDAGAAVRPELRILHVKCLDPLVIEVDELEIIELLQHEVTRIEQDVRAPMAADRVEEALERDTVVQVLARMDLEADVDARFVERVEDRPPTPRELREAFLDETGGPLRPRIHRVPQERAREGRVR